jgi:hypothetical protein
MFANLKFSLQLESRETVILSRPAQNFFNDMPILEEAKFISTHVAIIDNADPGSVFIYDNYANRFIFMCTIEVGRCSQFLLDNNIDIVIDISKEPETFDYQQTSTQKQRTLEGIISVTKLIMASTGNIAVHCNHGRTRSPAYVAAYLTIVECKSPEQAYRHISEAFLEQRPGIGDIDRHQRFPSHLCALVNLCETPISK